MAKTPSNPTFANFFRGIGESKYDQGGFDSLIGIDVNSEKGI